MIATERTRHHALLTFVSKSQFLLFINKTIPQQFKESSFKKLS